MLANPADGSLYSRCHVRSNLGNIGKRNIILLCHTRYFFTFTKFPQIRAIAEKYLVYQTYVSYLFFILVIIDLHSFLSFLRSSSQILDLPFILATIWHYLVRNRTEGNKLLLSPANYRWQISVKILRFFDA